VGAATLADHHPYFGENNCQPRELFKALVYGPRNSSTSSSAGRFFERKVQVPRHLLEDFSNAKFKLWVQELQTARNDLRSKEDHAKLKSLIEAYPTQVQEIWMSLTKSSKTGCQPVVQVFYENDNFLYGPVLQETEEEITVVDPMYGRCRIRKNDDLRIVRNPERL